VLPHPAFRGMMFEFWRKRFGRASVETAGYRVICEVRFEAPDNNGHSGFFAAYSVRTDDPNTAVERVIRTLASEVEGTVALDDVLELDAGDLDFPGEIAPFGERGYFGGPG